MWLGMGAWECGLGFVDGGGKDIRDKEGP